MMNDILHDLILSNLVAIYMDDILIYGGDTLEQHQEIVEEVLTHLFNHDLTCKPQKCKFHAKEVEYLGLIISPGQMRMDPVKTAAILKWPIPTCKKELQRFLGFLNFYRCFIPSFSLVARPLHKLTGKTEFVWSEEQQSSFDQLKHLVSIEPILAMYKLEGKMKIHSDASQYAVGAILFQFQNDQWKTLAYFSQSLSDAERNYNTEDRELLGIIYALRAWRHYLLNALENFEIWTDHANLQYWKTPQKLNRRQARWLTELSDYNFSLHHLPGNWNSAADALSQRPDYNQGTNDNTNIVVLPSHLFRALIHISDIIQAIQDGQEKEIKQGLDTSIFEK
jgi:hypothetical protein